MYDVTHEELVAAVEAEERAWLSTDDIHPYKSRVPQTKGNTVSFPKITRFSTYLLRHYGAEIVEEINGLLYDGELAAICGVDGFYSQQLTNDRCRIDPRMTFWPERNPNVSNLRSCGAVQESKQQSWQSRVKPFGPVS